MTTHCTKCKQHLHKTHYCSECNLLHVPRYHIKTLQGMIVEVLRNLKAIIHGDKLLLRLEGNLLHVMKLGRKGQRFFAVYVTTEPLIKKDLYE